MTISQISVLSVGCINDSIIHKIVTINNIKMQDDVPLIHPTFIVFRDDV